jgi:hypothetical protein
VIAEHLLRDELKTLRPWAGAGAHVCVRVCVWICLRECKYMSVLLCCLYTDTEHTCTGGVAGGDKYVVRGILFKLVKVC